MRTANRLAESGPAQVPDSPFAYSLQAFADALGPIGVAVSLSAGSVHSMGLHVFHQS